MATKLDKQLKREIDVEGKAYMLTLSPEGLKVTEKGKRKGHELSWKSLVNGNGTLSDNLSASAQEHEEAEEEEEEEE
jgi:hypothetical protein